MQTSLDVTITLFRNDAALQRTSKRRHTLLIAVALIVVLLANSSPAQVLLDEDFSSGSLDGWSIFDASSVPVLQPWGPGNADVSDGELRLTTTGEVPPRSTPGGPEVAGTLLLTLDRSADDDRFHDGFLRSTFRVDTESNADFILRGDMQTFSGYVFAAASNRKEFIINRWENGFGVELAIAGADEGIDFTVGEDWNIEVGAVGNELSLRAWKVGDEEPESPQLVIFDDTFTSGEIGILGAVEAWFTTRPVRLDVSFDDLGFRTAIVPEPNSKFLFTLGLFLMRRRRQVPRRH